MKAVWEKKRLGEICGFQNGFAFKSSTFKPVGVPILRISNLQNDEVVADELVYCDPKDYREDLDHYRVVNGDLLIAMSGATTGKIGFNNQDGSFFLNQRVGKFEPKENLHKRFLYYYLSTQVKENLRISAGAAQPNLSTEQIRQFQIPVPSLSEQRRIVGILDEAFEGLATAKANAEQNIKNARALFESHLQAVFTQRGKGWVEKKLSDVCAITSTLVDPRKKEFLDLTHVGAGNIESQTGVFVDLKTAREEGLISGKFLFDETMVLYSKIRPYLMKVTRPDFNGLCSADMYPLTPLPNAISRDYLFHLLLSKGFTDYAVQGSARAGMPKVNREHLFEFKLWLPDLKKQKTLAANLDEIHEETQRLESLYQRKVAALDELKKSLLHRAFSGQL
jgi:type I restriction enzyme S subunit